MGASEFFAYAPGEQIKEAFVQAKHAAAWEHGHGGYTGTIAEKHDYVIIQREPITWAEAGKLAYDLIEEGDRRIDDKWGPCGAIRVRDAKRDGWLFFGWASD